MSEQPVVEVRKLTKRYGDLVALDNVSFHLKRGHILGFIGPNGAGKTTTIKILVGLAKPSSGSAAICGVDCSRESRQIKHLVGFMPDTFGAYDNMRVYEYLDFFGAAFKIPRARRHARIDEALEITGSAYMRDRFVEALSHGMKQRVAIARTLLHDPQVLILDEPANGLDPTARVEMRQIILKLAAMGKTIIVTSHILPELSRICDTVAIITNGQLRAFGTLDEIMRDLRQRRIIEVQLLQTAQVERAAGLLRQNLEPQAEVSASKTESMVRCTTRMDDAQLAAVLGFLVEAQVGVAQFREVQQDLEDAFLAVSRQGDAPRTQPAAAASGGPR